MPFDTFISICLSSLLQQKDAQKLDKSWVRHSFSSFSIDQKLHHNEYPKLTFTEDYLTKKSLYFLFSVLRLQQISVNLAKNDFSSTLSI